MSGTVLVAVDITHPEDAGTHLTKAKALADLEGARLAAITVIPDYGMSIVGGFFDKDAEHKALQLANDKLHEFVASVLGDGAEVKHIVAHGTTYEEILSAAKTVEATLIVIGAHKPGFTDYLLGPNAARVARHANCSVFINRIA